MTHESMWTRVGGKPCHGWSWRQLNPNGLVAIHGTTHLGMHHAIRAAIAYRKQTGENGTLTINLDGAVPATAWNARTLGNGHKVHSELRMMR